MKTLKMKMLPLLLLATIGLLFPACEGNNPDDDLVGVITLKMLSGDNPGYWNDHGGATDIVFGYIYGLNSHSICLLINNANNFKAISGDIVDMGKKRLSGINYVPSSGWTQETAVLVGHGYIFRWQDDNSGPYKYAKIYVKSFVTSTYGGIMGAEVQYCQWNPEEQN